MNIGIIHPHIKSLNHYRVLLSSGELFSIHNTQATKQRKSPVNKPPEDKLWACYLHACIKHVQGECISNQTLRERFVLPQTSSASVSRLIKEALAIGMIKPVDPDTAPRYMKYIPVWA